MKSFLLALVVCLPAIGQVRVDPFPSATTLRQSGRGSTSPMVAIPNATITVCNYPANGFPCTNFAQTYSDATLATKCPLTAQVTYANSKTCTNVSDPQGRFGFWLLPGTYVYSVQSQAANYGPYTFTAGGSGGGGLTYSFTSPLQSSGTIVTLPTTGTKPTVVSGTAGTPGNFGAWDNFGNLVDSGTNGNAIAAVIASLYAPLANPTFTGTLTAPAAVIPNLTVTTCNGCSGAGTTYTFAPPLQLSGTAVSLPATGSGAKVGTATAAGSPGNFVAWDGSGNLADSGTNSAAIQAVIASTYAPKANPVFTGTVTAPSITGTSASFTSLNVGSCTGCGGGGGGGGSPTGPATGVLAGTYPAPTFRDWVVATDYASVQAACTAVGSTGLVVIPWNYAGTDTTWNCGTTQIADQRNSSYTVWEARKFGLRGDAKTISDGFITGGSATLGSVGYCFTNADIAKHAKVLQGNSTGSVSVLPAVDLYATITATSSCQATLSVTSSATGALTNLKVIFGSDDSSAFRTLLLLAAAKPGGTAQIKFSAGTYMLDGPFYITTSMDLVGDGIATTSLRNIDPTNDLLIWKPGNQGVLSNAFPVPGTIRHLNFQGEGMGTNGSLLVAAVSSLAVEDVSFSGNNGFGILDLGERNHFDHIRTRNVRKALVTSVNWPANESHLRGFDLMDTGCILDSQLSSGTYFNNNINSVNGVYPGWTATGVPDATPGPYSIVQDPATAISLNGVADWQVADGTIKTTRCTGGVTVPESNGQVKISNVYTENGVGAGPISPDYVFGGPHPHSTTTGAITAASTTVDIQDGRALDNCMGLASDVPLTIEGPTAGTFANLYPPDFLFGSSAGSSIGGGITRGTFETVVNNGCVRNLIGPGWHAVIGRQGGSIAWPAGAIYEQVFVQAGNTVTLDGNHMHANSIDTGSKYTVNCAASDTAGTICGSQIVGLVPDLLHAWNTPLSQGQSRGVNFVGENSNSAQFSNLIGGTVQIQTNGYVDAHTAQAISLATSNPIVANNDISLQMPETQSILRRAAYATGNLPNTSYLGPFGGLQFGTTAGATTSPVGYQIYNNVALGGGLFGPLLQYANGYQIGDQAFNGTSNPNDIVRLEGDSTGTPGMLYQIYNPGSSSYKPVFNFTGTTQAQIAAGQPIGARLSLNLGNATTQAGDVLNNSLQLAGLSNVAAPTVTPTGGSATSYSYAVVAYQFDGSHTAAVNIGSTAAGPALLDGTHFNTETWSAPPGSAAYYNVFRMSGGTNTGQINAVPILAGATLTFADTGFTGTGSAPTVNTSGGLLIGATATNVLPGGKMEVDGDVSNVLIRGDGTLALVPTGIQPTCNSAERGSFWYTNAGSGTADTVQTCSKNAADAYAWASIGSGGGGGSTPGGVPNSIQFNSGGVLGGVNNGTVTQEFLAQTNNGAPLFTALSAANMPTGIGLNNLAFIAPNTLLGNPAGGTAAPQALSAAASNAILGTSPASTSLFGPVKCDGTTITCAAGVISSAPSFSAIGAGTNTNNLTMGGSAVFSFTSSAVINANQLNGAALPLSAACIGTNASRQPIAAACGGAGAVSSVSINGGTPALPTAGNVNLAIPTPTTPAGSGMTTQTSGSNLQFISASPVDTKPTNDGGYTIPAADCTGNGGTVIFTGTAGTYSAGIPQAGTGGSFPANFPAGCSMRLINLSTGTITVSFTVSTWNTVSGTNAIALAALSGSNPHTATVISNGTNFVGWSQ